jgi:hypothetical protein
LVFFVFTSLQNPSRVVVFKQKMSSHTYRKVAAIVGMVFVSSCASTGATFRSGVGDTFFEHPPYQAGRAIEGRVAIGHLPIAFQRGATQPASFDPTIGQGTPVGALLDDMNRYLDALGISTRVAGETPASAAEAGSSRVPPDVRFGCAPALGIAGNDCGHPEDNALRGNAQMMMLSVGRPSSEWIAWSQQIMNITGKSQLLVVTLEVGQYLIRQQNWRGSKAVELGTGNVAGLPWLSGLDKPVNVLQLTGALMDTEGKAIRIGAEGFLVKRTPVLASALGVQEMLTDDDVKLARTATRDDLPGKPLAWQVALRELVTQLTGR